MPSEPQALDLAALRQVVPKFPNFYGSKPIAFDLAEQEECLAESRRDEDPSEAILYVWPHHCDTLVVLFRGIGRMGGALPKKRWGRLFQSGVHVLVLNDRRRCFYGKGVSVFGTGLEHTLQAISALQQALGCSQLFTCGSSAGGSGALHYGALLGAQKILAFSPITAISADFYEQRDMSSPDSDRVRKRLQRFPRVMRPDERFDCRKTLQAKPLVGQAHVHYPTALYWDRMWGEHLQGLDGVQLTAHAGTAGHSLINDQDSETSVAAREVEHFLLAASA